MSEFELHTTDLDADEDADAKDFWSTTTFQSKAHADDPPFYALEICKLIVRLSAATVLEFGCNAGRNLELLGRIAAEAGVAAPVRAGVDINAESIAFGIATWDLDLRIADESTIREMDADSWDLIFTVSVLDHIPDPREALAALARAASRWLLLVEPHHDRTGRVDQYRSIEGTDGAVTPFSYIHDYDQLLGELGWVEVLNIPYPTGLARLGPIYRLRLLAADSEVAATLPAQVWTESLLRNAILGLLAERQIRVDEGRRLRARIKALEP